MPVPSAVGESDDATPRAVPPPTNSTGSRRSRGSIGSVVSHGPPIDSFGAFAPSADFAYPSWMPKTQSYLDFPEYDDDDDEEAPRRVDSVTIELKAKAAELEKQAAELKAHAQNCRDMAQMQELTEGIMPAPMMNPYAFFPNPMVGMQGPMPYPMPGMGYGGPMMPYAQDDGATSSSNTSKTTVMWRNIPNNFVRNDLLELLDSHGFKGAYDFFYSPVDFTSNALVGYAFINFVSNPDADRFYETFQGFTAWSLKSEKVSEVAWSQPLQGLEGHIERYRNSPVMHPDVSEDRRPLLFKDGEIIPFPKPTKKIRAPHLKECRPGK